MLAQTPLHYSRKQNESGSLLNAGVPGLGFMVKGCSAPTLHSHPRARRTRSEACRNGAGVFV